MMMIELVNLLKDYLFKNNYIVSTAENGIKQKKNCYMLNLI